MHMRPTHSDDNPAKPDKDRVMATSLDRLTLDALRIIGCG